MYIWKYELDLTWGCITSSPSLGTRQFYGCYCRAKRARVRCTIKHHTGGEHSAACRCACVCKGEGASTRKPEASPQEQNIVAATATFTVASAPRALRGRERTTRAAQASRRTLLFPPLKPPSPPGTAATAFAAAAASAAIKNIPERYPPPAPPSVGRVPTRSGQMLLPPPPPLPPRQGRWQLLRRKRAPAW